MTWNDFLLSLTKGEIKEIQDCLFNFFWNKPYKNYQFVFAIEAAIRNVEETNGSKEQHKLLLTIQKKLEEVA